MNTGILHGVNFAAYYTIWSCDLAWVEYPLQTLPRRQVSGTHLDEGHFKHRAHQAQSCLTTTATSSIFIRSMPVYHVGMRKKNNV